MKTRNLHHGRDRLIRLPEVESATGCKKSTIYKMLKDGAFPRPVRLSSRMVAWSESAVQNWVQERINVGAPSIKEQGVSHE